ncbi:4Fe-4S dicluster domain-containing protein [Maridesulfovibrio sp.]|uniref:4Fe-4S dicluster domain-containing protein n=1 Tax=Maridesulfovibrio sp. TaxID=2795000 RepID=UPI0039F11BDE
MKGTERQVWSPADAETRSVLAELKETVGACMQCGTCTASCPNRFAMDVSPRAMWRMIQFDMLERILKSHTFWLCSSCYMCTLRCPRGLKLTSAMGMLKRLARLRSGQDVAETGDFYEAFMSNVETYGRVQELSLMNGYFMKSMNPVLPLTFIPLGIKMLGKGKLHLPDTMQRDTLKAMFAKAREMEGR